MTFSAFCRQSLSWMSLAVNWSCFQNQQPLPEAFRTVLLQRPQLQIVVRPCMVDGHSIWQFQDDGKESYSKAVRVPPNPRELLPACQQRQIVKLPPSVISLAEVELGPVMGQRTTVSLHQGHNWVSMPSRVASLTTITFDMDHTSKPRGLPEGRSAVHALNSSACRVTSTISAACL